MKGAGPSVNGTPAHPPVPDWLRSAVFYQVYPQSFYDGNADGIGDLPGLTAKLDYLESLGVTALWINPIYPSPFRDAGYDVTDHTGIAPRYGGEADLAELLRRAHARGIRICLDLVPGHTSSEHPWFRASCRAEPNPCTNRYIWTDRVWEEAGGELHSVSGFGERNGSYVTNFFYCQPALNYGFARREAGRSWQLPVDHPDVLMTREELKKIMRHWLDRGVDGFRVDMAFSLVKNDPGRRRTIELWQEIRAMLDREYPQAAFLSEWGIPDQALKAGFHADLLIHGHLDGFTSLLHREIPWMHRSAGSDPSFFRREGQGDARLFVDEYLPYLETTRSLGYIAIPSGNHDMPRLSLGRTPRESELVFAWILTMPGLPFIYYGDEIGMRYVSNLPSLEGGYERTGSRTPMQWDRGPKAGFSNAASGRLYLPLDPAADRPCVADQEGDPESLLNRVRRLIRLRRECPALGAEGGLEILCARRRCCPLVYLRRAPDPAGGAVLVALNPAARRVEADLRPPAPLQGGHWLLNCGAELQEVPSENRPRGRLIMAPVSYGLFVWPGKA
jgi:glycosidase